MNDPLFFGKDVLFLGVESPSLYDLHYQIVTAVSPSEELISRYFELANYVPHVTLGHTDQGLFREDLAAMYTQAQKELAPYPTFNVSFVRVYQETEPTKYQQLVDIPLGD